MKIIELDIQHIDEVAVAIWKEFYKHRYGLNTVIKKLIQIQKDDAWLVLVALDGNDAFLGTCTLKTFNDQVLIASDVAVSKESRKKGVATALATESFKRARLAGFSEIWADFVDDLPSWHSQFYEKLGFLKSTGTKHVLFL